MCLWPIPCIIKIRIHQIAIYSYIYNVPIPTGKPSAVAFVPDIMGLGVCGGELEMSGLRHTTNCAYTYIYIYTNPVQCQLTYAHGGVCCTLLESPNFHIVQSSSLVAFRCISLHSTLEQTIAIKTFGPGPHLGPGPIGPI